MSLNYLITKQKHSFHLVDRSPFPFLTSFFILFFIIPIAFYLHDYSIMEAFNIKADTFFGISKIPTMTYIRVFGLAAFFTILMWFTKILVESQNFHSKKVQSGLKFGVLLFIVSEIMFFFAFFGGFFHFSLNPSIAIGNVGPPYGTQHLDFLALPLVNTILLLSSGVTITFAHAYILKNNQIAFQFMLNLTILLGICFLFCQAYEYKFGVKFSGRNNLYGSIFFITTGFHGLHVTIGTIVLGYCSLRLLSKNYGFTPNQHVGFEAAAGYGHFVDVVGLFLYITIYGGGAAIVIRKFNIKNTQLNR